MAWIRGNATAVYALEIRVELVGIHGQAMKMNKLEAFEMYHMRKDAQKSLHRFLHRPPPFAECKFTDIGAE